MSEMPVPNSSFSVPPDQDFNTLSFQGSMQQVLSENVGKYVIIEFLIGTGPTTSRQGLLYYVGSQFLVLYDEFESRYVVCDIFSVKFVTFLLPGYRPGQVPATSPADETVPEDAHDVAETLSDVPARSILAVSPSQAAYAHATRRNPSVRY